MNSFLRNTIPKLYNAVPAPVAATRDALSAILQNVSETVSLLCNRMMENMGYGRERLKDIAEEEEAEEEEEAKGQQQKPAAAKEEDVKDQQQELAAAKEQLQDDEQYDTVPKIKLMHEEKRVKAFRVTGNLNKSNTEMIMANITPYINMRTKVIYSFKSETH